MLFKKTYLLKFYFNYVFYMRFSNIRFQTYNNNIKNSYISNIQHSCKCNFVLYYDFFYLINSYSGFYSILYNFSAFFFSQITTSFKNGYIFSQLLKLQGLYKYYIYINYMCFYIYKFYSFLPLSVSSLPKKKKNYTVLKSPHKDKKSREQFLLQVTSKLLCYPSFLFVHNSFFSLVSENLLVKNNIHLNK